MLLFSNNLHRALYLNSHSLVCEIAILLKVHVMSHVSEGDTTCFNKLFNRKELSFFCTLSLPTCILYGRTADGMFSAYRYCVRSKNKISDIKLTFQKVTKFNVRSECT